MEKKWYMILKGKRAYDVGGQFFSRLSGRPPFPAKAVSLKHDNVLRKRKHVILEQPLIRCVLKFLCTAYISCLNQSSPTIHILQCSFSFKPGERIFLHHCWWSTQTEAAISAQWLQMKCLMLFTLCRSFMHLSCSQFSSHEVVPFSHSPNMTCRRK